MRRRSRSAAASLSLFSASKSSASSLMESSAWVTMTAVMRLLRTSVMTMMTVITRRTMAPLYRSVARTTDDQLSRVVNSKSVSIAAGTVWNLSWISRMLSRESSRSPDLPMRYTAKTEKMNKQPPMMQYVWKTIVPLLKRPRASLYGIRRKRTVRNKRRSLTRRSTRRTCSTRMKPLFTPAGPKIHIGRTPVKRMRLKSRKFRASRNHVQPKTARRKPSSTTKMPVSACSAASKTGPSSWPLDCESSSTLAWTLTSSPLKIMMQPMIISNRGEPTMRTKHGHRCL
mmetsp:Transcript_76755/g.237741  ORF Transcript_76755/g.237741 Transcript_76755/m.237741 type:complete len:285 (+) Transcript_76755:500-1354(+)